jgi:hypothetical protein
VSPPQLESRCRIGEKLIDMRKCACFGSIRKSDLVDSVGVAVISNRTRCRLEIVRKNTEIRAVSCGKYVGVVLARSGGVPVVGHPAAVERVPRRMCRSLG